MQQDDAFPTYYNILCNVHFTLYYICRDDVLVVSCTFLVPSMTVIKQDCQISTVIISPLLSKFHHVVRITTAFNDSDRREGAVRYVTSRVCWRRSTTADKQFYVLRGCICIVISFVKCKSLRVGIRNIPSNICLQWRQSQLHGNGRLLRLVNCPAGKLTF